MIAARAGLEAEEGETSVVVTGVAARHWQVSERWPLSLQVQQVPLTLDETFSDAEPFGTDAAADRTREWNFKREA